MAITPEPSQLPSLPDVPAKFGALLQEDIVRCGKIVKASGAKVD